MIEIIKSIFESFVTLTLAFNTHNISYTQNRRDTIDNQYTQSEYDVTEKILVEDIEHIKGSTSSVGVGNWWSYPSDIKTTTREGDDLLVLVNKEYKLPTNYVPSDLVSASNAGIRKGENFMLRSIVIDDLKKLVIDALADGIDLSIRSGYRSYNTQISTYNYWLDLNGGNIASADKVSARAGHSQHQLGTAIDFSSSEISDGLAGTFGSTQASKWLAENAWRYGFVISFPSGYENITGYSYESWHYRYIGIQNANDMIESGKILEYYLRSKN